MKNRVRVALSTANPPQVHCMIVVFKYGITDRRFVITVTPQNDICPQGRTSPRKAAVSKMSTPTDHVSLYINDRLLPRPA